MNDFTARQMRDKLNEYEQLAARVCEIDNLLATMENKGDFLADPFTSNTRESRMVTSVNIYLSPTQGGEARTGVQLGSLNIRASDLGDFLKNKLRDEKLQINSKMDKL